MKRGAGRRDARARSVSRSPQPKIQLSRAAERGVEIALPVAIAAAAR
jgi:hypothetical protein